jgi:glycosyltransferase involved in cell wall biosynthesis
VPVAALIEFPLQDFLPLTRKIRRVGGEVVYDRIDEWNSSLGGGWYEPATEMAIVEESDLLLASAPRLQRSLESRSRRPALLLPNAFDPRLFDPLAKRERPSDLPSGHPVLTYIGSLWGGWFDWDLLLRVAADHCEGAVVVIGDYRGQCPRKLPNLHFLGLKPQHDLPAYLAYTDVAIITWKVDAITAATSPIKAYEYLAMRVPVVAPALEALPDHPLLLRAEDHDDFLRKIRLALELTTGYSAQASFVESQSWNARVDVIEAAVARLKERTASEKVKRAVEGVPG